MLFQHIVPFYLNTLLAEAQLSIWYSRDWDLKAEQTLVSYSQEYTWEGKGEIKNRGLVDAPRMVPKSFLT